MALVSAHRGGAGDDHSLENTLAAFNAAIDEEVALVGRIVEVHASRDRGCG